MPPRRTPAPRRALRALAVLLALAAVASAGATSSIRIRAGDTLWQIAQRHHTTVSVLRRLNDLPGSATIYAGDLLKIPAGPTAAARLVERGYTVRAGDNLTSIARRYGVSVRTIAVRNKLPTSGLVVIGRRLAIPVRTSAAPTAGPATYNAGVRIPDRVRRSVAAHRAYLARRDHPSQAAVRALVYRTARRVGVDPSLALAVAYHESGFQQGVVSPVDAIGVMQVLPSTGSALSADYGRRLDLLQAEDNVLAGVLLLQQLVRSTGRRDLTLAGYYQGLGSVRSYGLLPQTRAYIRNVTALQARFRKG